tara:strand:- start:3038 stop:3535 length:498 start_codon:yes stop_codon:yes gene_type:complete
MVNGTKEMEVEHLLLILLGAYLVYHFFLRRCIDGFSVGGIKCPKGASQETMCDLHTTSCDTKITSIIHGDGFHTCKGPNLLGLCESSGKQCFLDVGDKCTPSPHTNFSIDCDSGLCIGGRCAAGEKCKAGDKTISACPSGTTCRCTHTGNPSGGDIVCRCDKPST